MLRRTKAVKSEEMKHMILISHDIDITMGQDPRSLGPFLGMITTYRTYGNPF